MTPITFQEWVLFIKGYLEDRMIITSEKQRTILVPKCTDEDLEWLRNRSTWSHCDSQGTFIFTIGNLTVVAVQYDPTSEKIRDLFLSINNGVDVN